MNKIDRYVIISYIKSFLLGMSMFFLVFLLAESINLTAWIMDNKFTLSEAFKYLKLGLPDIFINTAPLGILLGSLLSVSKMAQRLEITAMKTSGISFARISLLPIIFSFFITLFVFWLNIDILGTYNKKKSDLKTLKLENVEKVKNKKDFVLVRTSRNQVLYAGEVNKTDGYMRDIEIVDFKGNFEKIETIYTAKEAKLTVNNKWTFENLKEYNAEKNETKIIDNSKLSFNVPINEILADPVKPKQLTMKQLREKSVYFGRVGADTRDLLIEFYYRISFSFSSFIMSFIGLSLGSKYVRGGAALNIGLSIIIGYSYYGLSSILKAIAASGTIPIYLACWIPNILFLYIGIMLFRQAEH